MGAAARLAQRPRRVAVREELRRRRTALKPCREPSSEASFASRRGRAAAGRRRGAARAAAGGQALRGLLGISRRQARARRVAAGRARPRVARGARHRRARCGAVARAGVRLSARARRAPLLSRVRVGRRARRATTGRRSRGRRRAATTVAPLLPANTRILAALELPRGIRHHVRRGHRRRRVPRPRGARARAGALAHPVAREGLASGPPRCIRARAPAARASRTARAAVERHARTKRDGCSCDGVHWTSAMLATASRGPPTCWSRRPATRARRLPAPARSASTSRCWGPLRHADASGCCAARLGAIRRVRRAGALAGLRARRPCRDRSSAGDRPRRPRHSAEARRVAFGLGTSIASGRSHTPPGESNGRGAVEQRVADPPGRSGPGVVDAQRRRSALGIAVAPHPR